ncbi:hypothetical protein GE09DRAFT_1232498 [Coniochaeta sp. 2T2.1]|nr:hypothetical protein GE09DRAFT_1232498 [Coniochaeta sp. 2T2.1]
MVIASDSESTYVGAEKQVQTQIKDPSQWLHGFRLVLLSGASVAAVFLIALDQTIVGTAMPKITDEFQGLADVS